MSIFDKIKKQTEVFTYKAAGVAETARIRLDIVRLNGHIEEMKKQLGSVVYSHYIKGTDYEEDLIKICKKIEQIEKEKAELSAKLQAKDDGSKLCPKCNNPNPTDAKYCEKCGAEIIEKESEIEAKSEIETKDMKCPSCNKKVDKDSAFCSHCGSSLK